MKVTISLHFFFHLKRQERNGTLVYTLTDFNQSAHSPPDSTHCFMPQCCVLVSKYPYFYAMKECLSW